MPSNTTPNTPQPQQQQQPHQQRQKSKLLILITKSNWGGAQRYVFDIATHMREYYEVVVGLGNKGPLFEKLTGAGVRTISLPFLLRDVNPFKDLAVFFKVWKLLRDERPQVLHVNSSKIGGIGAVAGRLASVPRIVFTAHGWAFNEDRPGWQCAIIAFLHWITIVLCHQTIGVSQKMLRDVAWMPFVQRKMRLVWNGVSDEHAALIPRDEARAHLLSFLSPAAAAGLVLERPFICGAISELHRNKGLDFLINAVPLIRERTSAPFVFYVAGDGDLREKLPAMAREAGVENHVLFAGRVPDAARYVRGFDAFIMPSRTEGLPYALLEAGLAALPVIASNTGGIPEVVTQLENGILVRPGDAKEIADAVIFIMQEREKAAALGAALHERVVSDFSIKGMVEKTRQSYEKK